jgi:hypothetical protein
MIHQVIADRVREIADNIEKRDAALLAGGTEIQRLLPEEVLQVLVALRGYARNLENERILADANAGWAEFVKK